MIAIYDHIQELLAESRGCAMTSDERAEMRVELARAKTEQAEFDRAFDAYFEERR
jgi:hypothetical protein